VFKEIGQMMSLLSQPAKLQQAAEKLQTALAQINVDGDAGGGAVKVRVNGKMEVISCTLTADALADRELLEAMICSAVNQALEKAKLRTAEETAKMAGDLGMPAGLPLPGLGT
jgi:DNA-binding YbaB/EbfC family protein